MNEEQSKLVSDRTALWLSIDLSLRRALEAAANARAMTMSAWIREAITEKLKREVDDGSPA